MVSIRGLAAGSTLLIVGCSLTTDLSRLTGGDCAQTLCGEVCADLQADPSHCGSCGNACALDAICSDGACRACPLGTTACDGECVKLESNPAHCGSCGNSCETGTVCSVGMCSGSCADNLQECDSQCVDVTTDSLHCGSCDHPCNANETCATGSCEPLSTCASGLDSPLGDAWGATFDGIERPAADFATAMAKCEAFGARLPTATELYRISAGQPQGLATTVQTNYLWSQVPVRGALQALVRLSDGETSNVPRSQAIGFRCVCPEPADPTAFDDDSCHGEPGSACLAISASYNIDTRNRPPLYWSSALWECAFDGGRLPRADELMMALNVGAQPTSVALITSDIGSIGTPVGIVWSMVGGFNEVKDVLSGVGQFAPAPFRCVGHASHTTLSALPSATVSNAANTLAGDDADRPMTTWAAAASTCFAAGGELPTLDDLGRLLLAGTAPPGSNLWAGDFGYNTGVAIGFWSAGEELLEPQLAQGPSVGANVAYRCVYYPVDTTISAPIPAQCEPFSNQSCLEASGGRGVKLWFSRTARSAKLQAAAVEDCRQDGGRMASWRDLRLGIAAGLVGTGVDEATSDQSAIFTLGPGNRLGPLLVKWDANKVPTESIGFYGTPYPYRCVWTNEER